LVDCQVVDIEHRQQEYSTTRILGKRWTLMILRNLTGKKIVRFSEIKRMLTTISSTLLSERLLELEKEGLITKKTYGEIPLKVEYSLTDRGKELETILNELERWYIIWNVTRKQVKHVAVQVDIL
jgi:DNA-binding HxlR family transcriptional regulator